MALAAGGLSSVVEDALGQGRASRALPRGLGADAYADYHLSPTSVCRNKAVALAPEAHPVTRQYGKGGLPRASARDLGAFDSA